MKLCEYGCGKKAEFQLKNGKFCCSKSQNSCVENKRKNSTGLQKAHKEGKFPENTFGDSVSWRKGLTEKTDIRIKNNCDAIREYYKTHPGSFYGKKHSNKTKEALSKLATGGENGFIKTKYYKIFCPHMNKVVSVQGTYELKYAEYLNSMSIPWERSRKINLKYKNFNTDYWHTYYPDFYRIDSDEYIETKGWWFKTRDGKVDDMSKMKNVVKYNKNKKIIILMKEDLKKLGIKL